MTTNILPPEAEEPENWIAYSFLKQSAAWQHNGKIVGGL